MRSRRFLNATFWPLLDHVKNHVGVGIVCAVAYFDPGNWSVDLQAGASFGYRPMLFVVLMAGLGAIVLQTLACRLGCVTGLDLASHCRRLLYNHPRHPKLIRRLVLYPLYVLSEIAIVSTDLAELLGSAIGFCLIIPKLPLWAGVALTAADVFIFLLFSAPTQNRGEPARVFEVTVIVLVFAVFACFIALLVKVKPNWPAAFLGYVPSRGLFQSEPDAVYCAVGILGATVMPHALFLGSSLATQNRIKDPLASRPLLPTPPSDQRVSVHLKSYLKSLFRSPSDPADDGGDNQQPRRSLWFIKQHLTHGTIDVVSSLLLLAIPVNSAARNSAVGLFEAHDLIVSRLGNAAGTIFALALICAGQTSSITVTLAGQIVAEGFINWRLSPFIRRIVTRSLSLVPSVVVAIAVGRNGIDTLLVASQVALSVVLPFVAFPLIYLTSSRAVMTVRTESPPEASEHQIQKTPASPSCDAEQLQIPVEKPPPTRSIEVVNFSNGKIVSCLSYIIWCVVLVANCYAIAMLAINDHDADDID
ncbi:hypothetical protein AMATHDRAFT_76296 [Amanita thiersii Skay4041]|uniref:Natural resistance-associated macrophage protein n=1 Tax=Amanita thiersii Skay4041 TaxID=703135 RepID=A0A2A9NN87_9AGAR|nr:hypothetical protein AMATHDRAFT_76296 [Amanita thiersii Skay4041]